MNDERAWIYMFDSFLSCWATLLQISAGAQSTQTLAHCWRYDTVKINRLCMHVFNNKHENAEKKRGTTWIVLLQVIDIWVIRNTKLEYSRQTDKVIPYNPRPWPTWSTNVGYKGCHGEKKNKENGSVILLFFFAFVFLFPSSCKLSTQKDVCFKSSNPCIFNFYVC